MHEMQKKELFTAIIVAAGTGRRMNSSIKKQYMEISGHPVLYHTLKAFEESDVDDIVIVTGSDEVEYVAKEIVEKYGIKKVTAIVPGGKERCDSVFNGVRPHCGNVTEYVLIHDGVRPLVTAQLIDSCIEKVKEYDAVIPGVPEKDTVKEADPDMNVVRTPDRKTLFRIQTPQCFKKDLIKKAFDKFYSERELNNSGSGSAAITDDAMLVERYTGHKVKIIEGDYNNIKITTPEDIEIAEYYLDKRIKAKEIK